MESSELERSFYRLELVERAVHSSAESRENNWRSDCGCSFCMGEYYAEWQDRWTIAVLIDKER